MRRILLLTALAALAAIQLGCGSTHTANPVAAAPMAPAYFAPHGFDLSAMDTSVKACDDFYRFAVGKWRDTHPLPPQYSRYGRFEEVSARNRDVLHSILDEAAAAAPTAP